MNNLTTKITAVFVFWIAPFSANLLHARSVRTVFFEKIGRIEVGMPQEGVQQILGRPDAIRGSGIGGIARPDRVEFIWRYGVDSKNGFPTLGEVWFDRTGVVVEVLGDEGDVFKPGAVSEKRLRELLCLIDSLPKFVDDQYNPMSLVLATNVFQPLGQPFTFAVLDEYLRVTEGYGNGTQGICLLLLCLHTVPANPGLLPRVPFGLRPIVSGDPTRWPRFPVKFENGVPFLLASSLTRSGRRDFAQHYMVLFEGKIDWRDAPVEVNQNSEEELGEEVSNLRQQLSEDTEQHFTRFAGLDKQLARFLKSRDKKGGGR